MFGQFGESDPLTKRAEALINSAHSFARGLTEYRDEYACLESLEDRWWDFFITVAGVFVASTRLKNLRVGAQRESRLMEIVALKCQNWNPKAIDGFEDCKAFFNRTYDGQAAALGADEQRFVSSDAIGAWITWNLLDRPPNTMEERKFVRSIGALVTHAFYGWWDE